jgi:hypothetical protein
MEKTPPTVRVGEKTKTQQKEDGHEYGKDTTKNTT